MVDEKIYWEEEEEFAQSIDEELTPVKHTLWRRIIAAITVIVFAGTVGIPIWKTFQARLPSADLITDSLELKSQVDPGLLDAIVKITATVADPRQINAIEKKSGTGFNIDSTGHIVTNHHVIAQARSITVAFPGGQTFQAKTWASKPEYDLAILELEAQDLPAISLNLDNPAKLGDPLLIIGNPLEFNQLAVQGQLREYIFTRDKPTRLLLVDAPIFPGNSGSPVLDNNGQAIAVAFGSLRQKEDGREKFYGVAMPIVEILDLLKNE